MNKAICDICGESYTKIEKRLWNGELITQVMYNDKVRIDLIGDDSMYIHTFNTCPRCARNILDFIKAMKVRGIYDS